MKKIDNAIFMEQEEYEKFLEGNADSISESRNSNKSSTNNDDAPKMNLYEMNQMLISQMPIYQQEEMDKAEDLIYDWIYNGHRANYYMLLCKELSYYTLFHSIDNCLIEEDFIRELWDVCSYLGPIHDISVDDNDAIAIWAEWEDAGVHCFYLFPYDKGVVEF